MVNETIDIISIYYNNDHIFTHKKEMEKTIIR